MPPGVGSLQILELKKKVLLNLTIIAHISGGSRITIVQRPLAVPVVPVMNSEPYNFELQSEDP